MKPVNIVNVGYDSANYYVLDGGRARLLVDCGWPGTLPKLQAACKRMGIDLASLGYLLVTHFHPDHAGLAQELKKLGPRLILPGFQVEGARRMPDMIKPSFSLVRLNLDDNLRVEAEASRAFLAGLGFAGEFLPTPGHSDDSLSLVLDDGSAFTGDLHPPALADEPARETVRKSWESLRAKKALRVYPGHGPARKIEEILAGYE